VFEEELGLPKTRVPADTIPVADTSLKLPQSGSYKITVRFHYDNSFLTQKAFYSWNKRVCDQYDKLRPIKSYVSLSECSLSSVGVKEFPGIPQTHKCNSRS